uniref:C2H2-type domain-containing protein n=1 Tax=Monopterus albus TaxID=43700 RepID=A0A3Q3K0I6_MONAL
MFFYISESTAATMSDLKPNAQEDKDAETSSDSPGRTQEPLQSHTFSLKNNAAGLSSDEHENPLNGTQPNPFVYSSVPAVPHAGNSLPSGALVNGPGSHPTSEVHCVLNKGTVLSNNVLDAVWQAEKDTSPEVLQPPSELQSDAWRSTAGPAVKTLATQPCVNTPLSHSEENESKLAFSTLSGDSAEQMHISQPSTKQTIKARSRRNIEWSESSSDEYDDAEVIRWEVAREHFLHNGRRLETEVMHQTDRKRYAHVKRASGSLEKGNNSLYCTYRHFCSSDDGENVDIANKDGSLSTQTDIKYSVAPFKDLPKNTALDFGYHISSTTQEGCNENDPEHEDNFSPKVDQLNTEQLEQDPLFFSCTICNVSFKEKRHFHRHMMYHLGKHNQVNSENVSQPFLCRECGRVFCDSYSLMRHIIIHQDRLEKPVEEINGLKKTEFEDRPTTVQRPQCVLGCNSQKIFVQHAKTQDNLKHYYFCEECNYITLTQQALEAHLQVAHLTTYQPQNRKMTHTNDAEEADHVRLQCEMGFFSSRDQVVLGRCSELENQRPHYGHFKIIAGQPKIARCKPSTFKSALRETAHLPHSTNKLEDTYIHKSSDKTVNSPLFEYHVGCTKNMLSSLWTIDKHGKLLLQPVENLDVATDLTCVEGDTENSDCKAFGSLKQANCAATTDFLLSARNLKLDQMFCQGRENGPASESLQVQTNQHSPSVSKMPTPLHNTIGNLNDNILPKLSQRLQKQSTVMEFEQGCEGSSNFSKDNSEAPVSSLESTKNERNPYARRYFRKRQRFSDKDPNPPALQDEDGGEEDCSDIEQLIIKEEYIDATACDDSPESPCVATSNNFDVFPTQVAEHKPCPYCPAVFESGVGLSNHVRGHLHRVGLSYNARHMVSPAQVALRDNQLQIRRRISAGTKKMRKAAKPETQGEHTCPLCWGWFDTKTGLSNHVRGHLKRIGRSVSSSSKSPLCILNELLQDEREHRNILQLLKKSRFPPQPFVSQKFISSNGLFLMKTGIPVKIQYGMRIPYPILDSLVPKQEVGAFSERKKLKVEALSGTKASLGTLVELFQTREEDVELTVRNNQEAYATRKFCDMAKEYKEEIQMSSYDYKLKKPRPRPGLKQKILPSLSAEIYTLTCRFCDLVFQGPLSVQEDWIRHLQRHLLHTSVPHAGTGMVEVLGLHHKIEISMSRRQPNLM